MTLSIGGNDFASCVGAGDLPAVVTCVFAGIERMRHNLPAIAKGLRTAAGKKPVIMASTYPDIALGAWVSGASGQQLAAASVPVFRDSINPTLRSAYAKQDIGFVDATDAFGAYIPFAQTTTFGRFGELPFGVADICRLAWSCNVRPQGIDIHLKRAGYRKLGKLYFQQIQQAG